MMAHVPLVSGGRAPSAALGSVQSRQPARRMDRTAPRHDAAAATPARSWAGLAHGLLAVMNIARFWPSLRWSDSWTKLAKRATTLNYI